MRSTSAPENPLPAVEDDSFRRTGGAGGNRRGEGMEGLYSEPIRLPSARRDDSEEVPPASNIPASERRGNTLKGCKDLTLNAQALTVLHVPNSPDSGFCGPGKLAPGGPGRGAWKRLSGVFCPDIVSVS